MRLRMYGGTDKGLVRANNQDAYFCSAEFGLVIVSDGMGGHKGGEIASQLVVQGLRDAYLETQQILVENVGPFLDDVLRKINQQILDHAAKDENLKGMGATVNYLQFAGEYVAVGHAGDSRTYLLRAFRRPDNRPRYALWCVTVDHNVGTFVERGLLVPGKDCPPAPLNERQKSRLMRGMGVVSDLKADLYCRSVLEGDIYLTCSDGLHGFVSDKDILKAVVAGPIAQGPERLIELAIAAGAPDNVTVVLSVISEHSEPMRDFTGPIQDRTPYLVRLPGGEILGPLTTEELTKDWLKGVIPNNAEVAASLNRWVFLNNREMLFKYYPDFETDEVRNHFSYVAPDSHIISQVSKKDSTHQMHFKIIGGSLVLLFLFVFIVNQLGTRASLLMSPIY